MFIGPLSFLFVSFLFKIFISFSLMSKKKCHLFYSLQCNPLLSLFILMLELFLIWPATFCWLLCPLFSLCFEYFFEEIRKAQFHQMLFYICLEILCIFSSLICCYEELHWLIFCIKQPCFSELSKTIYSWIHLLLFC